MKRKIQLTILFCILLVFPVFCETDTNTINNWNEQALDLVYSRPESAMQIARKALSESRRLHFSRGEVRALIRMGIIYDVQSNNARAIEMYQQSLDLCRKTNDLKAWASNLNNLGLIYWKTNYLEKALRYFNRAYSMFGKLEDEYNMASSANNIGLILEEQTRSGQALKWHKRSIEHCLKAGDKELILDVYSNIGNAWESLNQKDSSRFYTRKAISGYRRNGNKYGLGIALNNLGISYNKNEQQLTIPLFEESMRLAEELKHEASYVSSGYNLASAYGRLQQYADQLKTLQKVYPHLKRINSNELGFKICHDLAICHFRNNDFEKGMYFEDAYKRYHEAYYKEILSKNLSEAEKKFEVREERQRTIFKLEEASGKRFRDNIIWLSGLTVLLLAGLLTFFIIRKRGLQRELLNQKAVFDATNEERKRISYDLHDHVGSQLSYVVNNLELIHHLDRENERVQRAFSMSQAAMSSLRDTVWALHSEELTVQALSGRMENVARKLLEQKEGIQLLTENNVIENSVIPQQHTMHIMRVFQEAVHNVIKHSGATQLTIGVSDTEDQLCITIRDNGSGMINNGSKPFHYGLQSMKERAAKIGGLLNIECNPGTCVTLTLKKKGTTLSCD